MDLRASLTPPVFDKQLVARLATLADQLDGARPGEWDADLAEFNRLAGTAMTFAEFPGVYGGGTHAAFVLSILRGRKLRPDPNLTRAEMTEIVSRIMAGGKHIDFYIQLFGINCRHPASTDLLFWPDGINGLPTDREATAEEIAILALPDPA